MLKLIFTLTTLLIIQQTLAETPAPAAVVVTATCTIVAAENAKGFSGVLQLAVVEESITVNGVVKNVNNAWNVQQDHAVAVHEFSILSSLQGQATACSSIGGHYNKAGNKHGAPNKSKTGRHNGDWGNSTTNIDSDLVVAITDIVFFDLNDLAGRSIGIYSIADDLSDPIGDAKNVGAVAACCTITLDAVDGTTAATTYYPQPTAAPTQSVAATTWHPAGCDTQYANGYPWPWYWVPPGQYCTPPCWTPGPGIKAPSWWVPPAGYPYTTTTTAAGYYTYPTTPPPTSAPTPPPPMYYAPGYVYPTPPPPPTNAPTPPDYCYDCYYNIVECPCVPTYLNPHCSASQGLLALLAVVVALLALVF